MTYVLLRWLGECPGVMVREQKRYGNARNCLETARPITRLKLQTSRPRMLGTAQESATHRSTGNWRNTGHAHSTAGGIRLDSPLACLRTRRVARSILDTTYKSCEEKQREEEEPRGTARDLAGREDDLTKPRVAMKGRNKNADPKYRKEGKHKSKRNTRARKTQEQGKHQEQGRHKEQEKHIRKGNTNRRGNTKRNKRGEARADDWDHLEGSLTPTKGPSDNVGNVARQSLISLRWISYKKSTWDSINNASKRVSQGPSLARGS